MAEQANWRFCQKCHAMFFAGYGGGRCPTGGSHSAQGVNFVLLHDVPSTSNAQQGWRFCEKCHAMFFGGYGGGQCPAGGNHSAQGFIFVLPHDVDSTETAQQGWRFCQKCHALFFAGYGGGRCPTGGAHSAQGFTFVLPHRKEGSIPWTPPQYYTVTVRPSNWIPPSGTVDDVASAKTVVSIGPWQHTGVTIAGVSVKSRKEWGALEPIWANGVIYYNIVATPLVKMLDTIVVHHTDNNASIKENERRETGRSFAAIAYHFFIEKDGTIYEGRPLEIMGSHAGEGNTPGPTNDPDWGAIGIAVQGDYHHADDWISSDDPPREQLQSLEKLVIALLSIYPIRHLLMHREVPRKGNATVCPGDHMASHVQSLRKKLFPGE